MNRCEKHLTPSEEPISFKIKKINEGFLRDMNNRLKEDDLTYSQLTVLVFLRRSAREKTSLKDLCEALHITHPTGIGLIRRLSEKGLVESRVDPDNRRFRIISLTPKACELLHKSYEHRQSMDQKLISGLSEEEIFTVKTILDRMYNNIKDETEDEHA